MVNFKENDDFFYNYHYFKWLLAECGAKQEKLIPY
ncbi:hypothetical protein CHY_1891 [Carboxydothermus hydrogenoformans Z-2901]|uniref:Uncharacterized protein n=1 Tax=Carboxydothermus hydrogenoformans (strain ATCC BAA-161 / DSM 6008 / Z-2901) TaxID=246194 RepID=Q3AAX3_CARHZ|nr:hypothetical protein CHY_1891 [Carboxydothermus hydrogenoformans Z-2901]